MNIVLDRIPADLKKDALEILKQSKPTVQQKRALLLKKGLLRGVADELELFSEAGSYMFRMPALYGPY
jgi:eukaryotic translation initiation factor 2-alpha kinase 4